MPAMLMLDETLSFVWSNFYNLQFICKKERKSKEDYAEEKVNIDVVLKISKSAW